MGFIYGAIVNIFVVDGEVAQYHDPKLLFPNIPHFMEENLVPEEQEVLAIPLPSIEGIKW